MSSDDLNPNNKAKLVPIGEAAEILGVSIDTIRRWDKKGKLHSTRPDGKTRFFSITELEKIKLSKPLTISQVAAKLSVSPSTLRRLEEKGLIKPERNERDERIYTQDVLQSYLDSQYFMRQKKVQEEILEPLKEPAPKPIGPSPEVQAAPTVAETTLSSAANDTNVPISPEPKDSSQPSITPSAEPEQPKPAQTKAQLKKEVKDIQNTDITHRVYDFVLAENQRHIDRLITFRRTFYGASSFLVTLFFIVVASITIAFLLFPSETGEFFGYKRIMPRLIARNLGQGQVAPVTCTTPSQLANKTLSNGGRVLGTTWPGPWAERSAAAKALRPFSRISLQLVKILDPEAYETAVTQRIIPDVNDVFTIDETGAITAMYNFTFPDTSYLKIPDKELITNLNADYLRGRVPGLLPGNLLYLDNNGDLFLPGTISSQSIATESIQDEAIVSEKIAEEAVASVHLGKDSVLSRHIKDGEVKEEDLADGSVTTIKIADQTIITADLANNAVTSEIIKDGEVKEQDLANGAVTTKKIGDSAVTTSKIAENAISTDKINDQAVTSEKIADGTIQTIDIKDGVLTAVKIANDSLDFDQFQQTLDLDESTDLTLGAYNLTFNLDSSGDLIIADAGVAKHVFYDDGTIVFNEPGSSSADFRIEGNTDTAVFFFDASANSIGIGTTDPSSFKLQVAGNVGPNQDSAYDLGSSTFRWDALYVGSINAEGHIVATTDSQYNLRSSSF